MSDNRQTGVEETRISELTPSLTGPLNERQMVMMMADVSEYDRVVMQFGAIDVANSPEVDANIIDFHVHRPSRNLSFGQLMDLDEFLLEQAEILQIPEILPAPVAENPGNCKEVAGEQSDTKEVPESSGIVNENVPNIPEVDVETNSEDSLESLGMARLFLDYNDMSE